MKEPVFEENSVTSVQHQVTDFQICWINMSLRDSQWTAIGSKDIREARMVLFGRHYSHTRDLGPGCILITDA